MKKIFLLLLPALLLLVIFKDSPQAYSAANVPSGFTIQRFAAGFANRLSTMEFAPDGRLFVSEKTGALRVVKNGQLLTAPFLTVSVNSDIERGLMGIAFDPNFTSNKYIYIYYTSSSTLKNRLSRFTQDPSNPDIALAGSETILLDNIPSDTGYHISGAIHFGPDGKLYLTVGDSGISNQAQNLGILPGKILRLNSDGTIPSDNPFVGQSGKRAEIWAYGFRNPFTFAFQPGSGKLFINDVGNDTWEEINDVQRGGNYGWPTCEGICSNPSFINPIYQYNHNGASASITGGVFYNGSNFPSDYANDYFFADYSQGFIKKYDLATGGVTDFATNAPFPVDLRVASDGGLYYLSVEAKEVYRIFYGAAPTPTPLPGSGQISLIPLEDNHVSTSAPSTNYGLSSKMYAATNPINKMYLKFDLSMLSGKKIDGASFKFKTVNEQWSGTTSPQNVKLVDNPNSWQEQTLTYNNQPGMTTQMGTFTNLVPNTNYSVALDTNIVGQKTGGIISFGVESQGAADVFYMYSRENSTDKPQLVINYSDFAPSPTPTPAGQSPIATIDLPIAGTTFKAGDSIDFSGTGTDPEDGVLDPSRLTWEVVFHHDTHTHPFLEPFSGTTSGVLTLADTGEASSNIWYRIHLTATDSNGNTNHITRDLNPIKADVTLSTQPTGLSVNLDGSPKTAPYTFTGVVNFKRELSALSTQTLNGHTYAFNSWSDGGSQTHIISTPQTNTTYTAFYDEVIVPTPTNSPTPTPTVTPTPTPTPAPNLIQNPGFENTGTNWLNPWTWKLRSPAQATITRDTTTQHSGAASAKINITTASADWHVQIIGGNFQLTSGVPYTIKYWAKASSNRNIRAAIQGINSPYTVYFEQTRAITTAWQQYSVTFTPTSSNNNASINFNFGANTGQVWIDDVSVSR